MNSKAKDFLISLSIIFVFVNVLVLFFNYVLITYFGLNKDNFLFIVLPLVFFALLLFLFLSKSILNPLFKSNENLTKTVKETIHELNIPVSTIILNTQMLQRKISDEKALKRLERIAKASNDLLKLYEDMEYSIKKEIDHIENDSFHLDEIIEHSLDKIEDIRQNENISINKEVNSQLVIKSDKNGFTKVIDNLLSNAIKYNKKNGYINIGIDNNSILYIENSGKSIDTKHLFYLFDRFFQEDSSQNGFGLGLNIVKDFCDKNKIVINIIPLENATRVELNLKKQLL
ncbi:histidine kinase [Malaciobacter molluscorum LMG 25693]|uniref:histidine kinase n=1 Tax=Malaciobacter molluscorum LMG 25693 TaxID=870501 RepID=A0A2G1DKL2_9BACT|nr:HAMP domain-containing sensor histidine kinase [Malaciobacter molluscorum]AXX92528.1 two-component system sensor histidine kinase [Malaciobacter molluscorum LMG 25693]PHO18954.1 histidine kinase [Malaciobacter molluscorum LMG 25693]RXJ97258.1 histidine kinase [Malaciobacter molluscorum]